MGGRGKWSKVDGDGFTWYDYHVVYQEGNTHFLIQHNHNGGGISEPVMSKTSNVNICNIRCNRQT